MGAMLPVVDDTPSSLISSILESASVICRQLEAVQDLVPESDPVMGLE